MAFIVILLIGILLSGCKGFPRRKTGEEVDEPTAGDVSRIRRGTDGLEMEFVKNIPPDQVYDNEDLTIIVDIENKGAENIEDANFYIGGYDPNIISMGVEGFGVVYDYEAQYGVPLLDVSLEGYLPGKHELRGETGESVITFEGDIGGLPEGTDVYEPNFIVTACYKYSTKANPIVCIDPNPFGVYTASKSCQPKNIGETGGQGGPIAVTKVELVPSRGKVQFKIFVENKGGGKAIDEDKYEGCNLITSEDYRYVNRIDSYSVDVEGLSEIRCQPDPGNGVRLADDKGVIVCSFEITDQNTPAYTTPLEITLDYHYMKSTKPKKIKILNI